jgi:hypothetical protein
MMRQFRCESGLEGTVKSVTHFKNCSAVITYSYWLCTLTCVSKEKLITLTIHSDMLFWTLTGANLHDFHTPPRRKFILLFSCVATITGWCLDVWVALPPVLAQWKRSLEIRWDCFLLLKMPLPFTSLCRVLHIRPSTTGATKLKPHLRVQRAALVAAWRISSHFLQ